MVIDFHTHTFPAKISKRVLDGLSATGHVYYFTDGSEEGLADSMKKSGVDLSVNLPVATRVDQVSSLNDRVIRNIDLYREMGVVSFGCMHPDHEDPKSEAKKLRAAGIRGIKLHPAYAKIDFDDLRTMRAIDAANEEGLIVLTHAGLDISFLDHDFASVKMIEHVLDEVHPEKLVLAHMGGWQGWDEVEAYLAGAPVYLDTAYSVGPMHRKEGEEKFLPYAVNMDEERFLRLCRAHGTDRILFATDSPWSDAKEYLSFMDRVHFTVEERAAVMGGNAVELLGL